MSRGDVDALPRYFLSLLARQLDGVDLRRQPLAPVLARPAVLGQKRRITGGAAKGAAHVRVARPVEAAALDEAGRGAEDARGVDLFHARPPSQNSHTSRHGSGKRFGIEQV